LYPLYVMLHALQQTLPNGVPSNDPSLPDLQTPLYVLVNSNTASAAEVLAAALKVDCTSLSLALSFFFAASQSLPLCLCVRVFLSPYPYLSHSL
jgi:Peptidase family S41